MNTVYTIGYGQLRDSAQLTQIAHTLGAVVIDVRFSPNARLPQWRRGALETAVGSSNYVWVKAFGNANYKGTMGDGIVLVDPAEGTRQVQAVLAQRPVLLLCACRNHQACHRATVAAHLAAQLGVTVEHLAAPFQEVPEVAQQTSLFAEN